MKKTATERRADIKIAHVDNRGYNLTLDYVPKWEEALSSITLSI